MKRFKKLFLTTLTLLMIVSNVGFTPIFADDGVKYKATFEFIISDDSDVPSEVNAYCPPTMEVDDGDVVTPESISDQIEVGEYIYTFKRWSPASKTVNGSNVHFIGLWNIAEKPVEKEPETQTTPAQNSTDTKDASTDTQEIVEPEKETFQPKSDNTVIPESSVNSTETEDESREKITVTYKFYEAFAVETPGNLPAEVMALLPRSYEIYKGDDESPVSITTTQVGNFTWQGWNPYHDDEGNVTYFGIWMSPDSKFVKPKPSGMLLRVSSSATFAFSGYWTVPNSIGYSGSSRFTLDGEVAYCIEPSKHMDNSYIGASYSVDGSLSNSVARIIAMGTKNGVDEGMIQAAVWNQINGTSGSGAADPGYSLYDGSGYNYSVDTYGSGSKQRLATNPSWEVARVPHGYVNVTKVASKPNGLDYVANFPNNYSIAGAVYGIYRDNACTNLVQTLTTNSTGKTSNSGDLSPGTYFVKEITASPGFKLDTNIYPVTVPDSDSPVTVTSNENPMNDPLYVNVYKKDRREKVFVEHLDEAQFTLKYYDAQTDNPTALTPKYTFVYKSVYTSDGKVKSDLSNPSNYISGDDITPLIVSGAINLPLGTFTIQETKAPTLFAIDENIYVGHITQNGDNANETVDHYIDSTGTLHELGTQGGWLDVDNLDLSQNEELQTVKLTIQKIDEDTGSNTLPDHAISTMTLAGGEFRVYRTAEYRVGTDNHTFGLVDIDPVDYGIITTDETGKAELIYEPGTTDKLLPGKFKIVEEKAPNGYAANPNEFTISALISEANTANFEYSTTISDRHTRITVNKVDNEGEYLETSAGSTIQLLDPDGNVVYYFIPDGFPHIIRGLTTGIQYTIHELEVDPMYKLANDKSAKVNDDGMAYYTMVDSIVNIYTTATFSNEGKMAWDNKSNKNYVADGVAHINDEVAYEYVYAGEPYKLVGELIDKQTGETLQTVEKDFTPTRQSGYVNVEFDQQLDGLDNHDLVVFETLYHIVDGTDVKVTEHKDINDVDQTVHVDPIYKTDFIINKVNADDEDEKISGVDFHIITYRRKRDGVIERNDLGTLTTDDNGQIVIPSVKEETQLTVIETKEKDETWYKWPEPFSYNLGHDTSVSPYSVTIVNHQIKIHTNANFDKATKTSWDDEDPKHYVADGVAAIIDTVSYEWLYKGDKYIMSGTLYDLGTSDDPKLEALTTSETEFRAEDLNGTVEVTFNFDVTDYDNHNFVVFEELKHVLSEHEEAIIDQETGDPIIDEETGEPEKEIVQDTIKVAEHKDPDDADQTVHVDPLYAAAMILYKTNTDKSIKLNGAVFSITSNRTRRDGTVVEKNLGRYISGGIFVENEESFTYKIATDEEMSDVVETLTSSLHPKFKKQYVQTTDLPDGIYYGQIEGESEVTKYNVAKGIIYLANIEEETDLTYHEEIAPTGYVLPGTDYLANVGHDYAADTIENYRINSLLIVNRHVIPRTGIEENN